MKNDSSSAAYVNSPFIKDIACSRILFESYAVPDVMILFFGFGGNGVGSYNLDGYQSVNPIGHLTKGWIHFALSSF